MKHISRFLLKLSGWDFSTAFPAGKKYILIQAPHTSMWDFVLGYFYADAVGISPKFLIKAKYFFWPLGPVLRFAGAWPVHPNRDTAFYRHLVDAIVNAEEFYLIITPEGTRKATKRWKTGFYKLSVETGVPILFTSIDYSRKKLSVGPEFHPTGDMDSDIRFIMSYFKAEWGKHKDQFIEIGPVTDETSFNQS